MLFKKVLILHNSFDSLSLLLLIEMVNVYGDCIVWEVKEFLLKGFVNFWGLEKNNDVSLLCGFGYIFT